MISRREFGILGAMSTPLVRRPDQQTPSTSGLSPAAVPGNVFTNIFIVGSAGGLFLYNPTVGLNNLVASGAAKAGTNHGNEVVPGWTAYTFSGGTIQQYASIQAGLLQLGGGPPEGYLVIPQLGVPNGSPSMQITSGQRTGGVDGGIAALFLQTGAVGKTGYVLLTDQTTLLLAGAGPPATTAAIEVAATNGNGIALANLAGTPASVAGWSFWYSDAFTQLHTDRAIVTEVDVETKNQGSPPGAGGSGPKWYGSSGYGLYQSGQTGIGGDTNSYDTGRLTLVAAGQTVSSTVGVTVTGLTKTLGVGTYHVRGAITYQGSQNAGTPTIGFAEPLLTSAWYTSQYLVATNNASATSPLTAFNNTGFDGLSTSHTGPTLVLNQFVTFSFDAIVTTSASGALTMQAKTSNGADTFVIQAGGYMEIMPVVAT